LQLNLNSSVAGTRRVIDMAIFTAAAVLRVAALIGSYEAEVHELQTELSARIVEIEELEKELEDI